MTAAAMPLSRPRALSLERVTSTLFFTTLFVSTFEKVHWNFGGQLGINDITTVLFLIAFLASEREREEKFPRTSAIVLAFFAAFALVYLAGFWDLTTKQGLTVTGLVVSETADVVELLQPDATRKQVRKKDVENRTMSSVSPMPGGLVKKPNELRDLLAYLLSDNPLPP